MPGAFSFVIYRLMLHSLYFIFNGNGWVYQKHCLSSPCKIKFLEAKDAGVIFPGIIPISSVYQNRLRFDLWRLYWSTDNSAPTVTKLITIPELYKARWAWKVGRIIQFERSNDNSFLLRFIVLPYVSNMYCSYLWLPNGSGFHIKTSGDWTHKSAVCTDFSACMQEWTKSWLKINSNESTTVSRFSAAVDQWRFCEYAELRVSRLPDQTNPMN